MDCIEQLSTRQLVHNRIISLFFLTKFLMALVTGYKTLEEARLPCFPDEPSKAESLLAWFDSYEHVMLEWALQYHEASARLRKYARSYDPLVSACSKHLDASSLSYADVASLVAVSAVGHGYALVFWTHRVSCFLCRHMRIGGI